MILFFFGSKYDIVLYWTMQNFLETQGRKPISKCKGQLDKKEKCKGQEITKMKTFPMLSIY